MRGEAADREKNNLEKGFFVIVTIVHTHKKGISSIKKDVGESALQNGSSRILELPVPKVELLSSDVIPRTSDCGGVVDKELCVHWSREHAWLL